MREREKVHDFSAALHFYFPRRIENVLLCLLLFQHVFITCGKLAVGLSPQHDIRHWRSIDLFRVIKDNRFKMCQQKLSTSFIFSKQHYICGLKQMNFTLNLFRFLTFTIISLQK